MKKKIFLIIGIVILTGVILFRNIPFENGKIITLSDYVNQPATQITINIPKYSFNYKDVNYNVSANNFRSYRILKKDLEEILSSYRKISCDGKEYYYYNPDSLSDSYTIIDYGINNHYIYSTIYYKYSLGNYCEVKEIKDKVSYRTLYYQELAKENKKYTMTFLVGTTNDVYKAELNVYVYNETTKTTEVIEKSNGKFKLYNGSGAAGALVIKTRPIKNSESKPCSS
jgi:hypothetical protein